MHHIRKHPKSGVYHYRQAIPKSLKPLYNKAEYIISLRTKDPTLARLLAYQLSAKLLVEFEQAKAHQMVKPTDLNSRLFHNTDGSDLNLDDGVVRKWTVDVPGIGSISTDPNAKDPTQEHQQALEALKYLRSLPTTGSTSQASTGPVSGSQGKTLAMAYEEYVADLTARNVRSIKHIKPAIYNFVEWMAQEYPSTKVNAVQPSHIKGYRNHLRSAYNKRTQTHGISENTIYKRLGFLETFFRWCQDNRYLGDGDRNLPTYRIKGKKPDQVQQGTTYKAFSKSEISKIFDVALFEEPIHLVIAVLVGAYTGGRLAEVCHINPDDLDLEPFEQGTISFDKAVKNSNSNRTIPVHDNLLFLKHYKRWLLCLFPEAKTLFPWLKNPDKRVGDAFGKYLDRIGIIDPSKVFHSFRKNVSQQLKMTGCPQQYAEYYVGHLNRSLHNSVYAGINEPVKNFKHHIDKITYQEQLSDLSVIEPKMVIEMVKKTKKVPNQETLEAMKEADLLAQSNPKGYDSIEDLMAELNKEDEKKENKDQ